MKNGIDFTAAFVYLFLIAILGIVGALLIMSTYGAGYKPKNPSIV